MRAVKGTISVPVEMTEFKPAVLKAKPILMSGVNVRGILEGRKNQTRRVVNGVPYTLHLGRSIMDWPLSRVYEMDGRFWLDVQTDVDDCTHDEVKPAYKVGDYLWVKENWAVGKPHDKTKPSEILAPQIARGTGVTVLYAAGGDRSVGPPGREELLDNPIDVPMPSWAGKLRPSIFMPRAFSRIMLQVTEVRVERVQEITGEDCIAEGIKLDRCGCEFCRMSSKMCPADEGSHIEAYRDLWDSLNQKRGFGWEVNPFVLAYTFRRVKP